MDIVVLHINGRRFEGWKDVSINRGLNQAASGFRFSSSERYPSQQQPLNIQAGDECTVNIGGDLVVTGYVDAVSINYDGSAHTIQVTGRSKTQDLIDCAAPPPWYSITQQTILEIANRLAEPYGVDITDNLRGDVEPVDLVEISPGETVLSVLEKLATTSGVLLTDDEQGRLLITRAGLDQAQDTLTHGENILAGSGAFAMQQRFRDYLVIGQRNGTNQVNGTAASEVEERVQDLGVPRPRLTVLSPQGALTAKKAQDRGRWEASRRMAGAVTLSYTVAGWRQRSGALWRVNQRVVVRDPLLTIKKSMLIAGITYELSSRGSVATLQLSVPEAYEVRPETQASPAAGVGIYKNLDLS